MTITTELRGHTHRHKMSHALSMMSRLVRWERFARDCTLVARVDVQTDRELREILEDCSDFWELDTEAQVLTRANATSGEDVRIEIGVSQLLTDDVYRIVRETEPAW